MDDEEYEKKDNFFIELGQPQWLKRGISGEDRRGGSGRATRPREGDPERPSHGLCLQAHGSEFPGTRSHFLFVSVSPQLCFSIKVSGVTTGLCPEGRCWREISGEVVSGLRQVRGRDKGRFGLGEGWS